jgi:hypothetical protein
LPTLGLRLGKQGGSSCEKHRDGKMDWLTGKGSEFIKSWRVERMCLSITFCLTLGDGFFKTLKEGEKVEVSCSLKLFKGAKRDPQASNVVQKHNWYFPVRFPKAVSTLLPL